MRDALVSCLLIGSVVLHAGDSNSERRTLRGVAGVRILIEDIDSDAIEDGLTRDQIQTDVELSLRKAGVPINDESRVFLHVSLLFSKDKSLYTVYVRVEVNQPVRPLVSGELSRATTWSVDSFGTVGAKVMVRSVRDVLGDELDKFNNAYLSVNPKK